MAFQFTCPQGHLLEAEPYQAGDQCTCPVCHVEFLIPDPPPGTVESAPATEASAPANEAFPQVGSHAPAAFDTSSPTIYHIPCPQGHILETPPEMFNQWALCPYCQTKFQLREKDSQEYKRRRQIENDAKDHKLGNMWLNWTITIAVLVVVGLVFLIMLSE